MAYRLSSDVLAIVCGPQRIVWLALNLLIYSPLPLLLHLLFFFQPRQLVNSGLFGVDGVRILAEFVLQGVVSLFQFLQLVFEFLLFGVDYGHLFCGLVFLDGGAGRPLARVIQRLRARLPLLPLPAPLHPPSIHFFFHLL